jgi:hypothetical protein
MHGNGDGTFAAGSPIAVAGGPISIGDVDGDGLGDLAIVAPSKLSIALGTGGGTFGAVQALAIPATFYGVEITKRTAGEPMIVLVDSGFGFALGLTRWNNGALDPIAIYSVGAGYGPAFADFDGDGFTDFAETFDDQRGNGVAVLLHGCVP